MSSYTLVEQQQEEQQILLLRKSQKMAGVVSPEGRAEQSFWSILAQKAKSVLVEDDNLPAAKDSPTKTRSQQPPKDGTLVKEQSPAVKLTKTPVKQASMGRPLQKGLDAIASSLSLIGDTLGTAIEDGFHMMDGKPSPVKSESPEVTKSLQKSSSIWKKVEDVQARQPAFMTEDKSQPGDVQLKASRDVARAMASKAKALLRELKTVKAEQTFLRNRCAQLEEENRQLREGASQGDDFVRHQLESLLAEKQRLAQENANYARENQLLHEVVEYHHLTLQDVAFLDERLNGESEGYSPHSDDSPLNPQQLSFEDSYYAQSGVN